MIFNDSIGAIIHIIIKAVCSASQKPIRFGFHGQKKNREWIKTNNLELIPRLTTDWT